MQKNSTNSGRTASEVVKSVLSVKSRGRLLGTRTVSILFLVGIALIAWSGCQAEAQSPAGGLPGMFTVEYKLLLALHPYMSNFDIVLGRHLRSDVNYKDPTALSEINKKINALSVKAGEQTPAIQKEIDKLRLQISDIQQRSQSIIGVANAERGGFTGQNTQQIQKAKISELERQVLALEEKREAVSEATLDPLYLSRAQSRERINQALTQIDAILEAFSRQRGGAIIVDRDFVRVQIPAQHIPSVQEAGADPLTIALYQSLLEADFIGKVPPRYLSDPELRPYANKMVTQLAGSFDRGVAGQIARAPLSAKLLGIRGRLFLTGTSGTDLTREILAEIFRQNRIPNEISQRILAQIPSE
ncbi:MAG: hypothetical protein WA705_30725 [Candidatus Ozemobacteraceae bacterium]